MVATAVAAVLDAVPTSADTVSCTYHIRTDFDQDTHPRCRCEELPACSHSRLPAFDLEEEAADTANLFSFSVVRQRMSS